MWAFLWTPAELIQLDLQPLLAQERRALARMDDRNARSVAPLFSLARRSAARIDLLELAIGWVRGTPAHDAAAAQALVARLRDRAAVIGRGGPGYILLRVAEAADYRLRPHRIKGTKGSHRVDWRVRARAAAVCRTGSLVEAPPASPGGGPGAARSSSGAAGVEDGASESSPLPGSNAVPPDHQGGSQ